MVEEPDRHFYRPVVVFPGRVKDNDRCQHLGLGCPPGGEAGVRVVVKDGSLRVLELERAKCGRDGFDSIRLGSTWMSCSSSIGQHHSS